jgi:F-type H+-transporting ATPase subunit b
MFEEKFWLAISFLSFVVLIIKFFGAKISSSLNQKSKEISDNINLVSEQKKQSQLLLVEAQKIYEESIVSAKKLIEEANQESIKMLNNAQVLLDQEINRMKLLSSQKIKQEEEKAIRLIKNKVILDAIAKVQQTSVSINENKKLIDNSLKNIETIH